jgi:hypothetical protein
MVVRVRVDQHASFHDLVAKIDPTAEFHGAINNGLIPSHCLRFDLTPIAYPLRFLPIESTPRRSSLSEMPNPRDIFTSVFRDGT